MLAMDAGWPLSQQTQITLDVVIAQGVAKHSNKGKDAKSVPIESSCDLPNLNPPKFDSSTTWDIEEDTSVGTVSEMSDSAAL